MSQTAFRAPGSASFRDPSGRLLLFDDRVFRLLNTKGASDLRSFLATTVAHEMIAGERLVRTRFIDQPLTAISLLSEDAEVSFALEEDAVVVEHERVVMRSFPYEWPPQMLHAAGRLMLELAASSLSEGFSLKDATPYNVLFRGARPVFVDVASFERRDPCDPTWLPLNQFAQTVLLPLLVNKYFGLHLDQLLVTHRDGLEPAAVARLCGASRKLNPLFLSLIFLPHWLSGKQVRGGGSTTPRGLSAWGPRSIYQPKREHNPERARFVLQQQFKRLGRQLAKVEPANTDSAWSGYMTPNRFFSKEYLAAKEAFVTVALAELKPARVLDVGCNTGHFSRMAALAGSSVVAIDQDAAVAGAVWQNAAADGLDILPLVVNLARPTPALGWRNEECPAFLDRARGEFDLVLMLAVLHHMLVTEQIPLPAILELAAELTSEFLLIEFVAPEDEMFRTLVHGREELFLGLNRESFTAAAQGSFSLVRTARLSETRWIYLLRKRGTAGDV